MDSEEKKTFLNSKIGGYTFWLGASDAASEGSWTWSDGSAVSWTSWAGSEPNGGTTEDCLAWYGHGRYWFDSRCSSDRYFTCSIKVRERCKETVLMLALRTVTERQDKDPAVPPPTPAGSGAETVTPTATVLETWSVGRTTATSPTPGSPPPRTAVSSHARGCRVTGRAALLTVPVVWVRETVTETRTVWGV